VPAGAKVNGVVDEEALLPAVTVTLAGAARFGALKTTMEFPFALVVPPLMTDGEDEPTEMVSG
jgi:hypothetical protein